MHIKNKTASRSRASLSPRAAAGCHAYRQPGAATMKRKRRQNRRRRHSPAALTHKVPVRLSRPRVAIDAGCAWFAVWTEPRGERRVMAGLERAGSPATSEPCRKGRAARRGPPGERMAAARYLFVGLSAAAPEFGAVHAVDGVKALVAAAGAPLRVPACVLQAYADALSNRSVDFRGGAVSRP